MYARLKRATVIVGLGLTAWTMACDGSPDARECCAVGPDEVVAGHDETERRLLRSMSIAALDTVPVPPGNAVADEPGARALGHRLFFDTRLSADGRISCAHCHRPERLFTDGLPRSRGLAEGPRNAPTLLGVAHASWLYWDGRRDSLWAQALAPIEAPNEMGLTRVEALRLLDRDPDYRDRYTRLFGPLPELSVESGTPLRAGPHADEAARSAWTKLAPEKREAINRAFGNLGRAIAAYERLLVPAASRFDRYVERVLAGDEQGALSILDAEEVAGLRLFLNAERARCLRCHNGPLLTNQSFHDVGTSRRGPLPDLGRFFGVQALFLDEFNCLGAYSGVPADDCSELRFLDRSELGLTAGAFKTPTLRGLGRTGPFFHDGSAASLSEVLDHYRNPPTGLQHELTPLDIDDVEAVQLERFLLALDGDASTDAVWLAAPTAPGDAPRR